MEMKLKPLDEARHFLKSEPIGRRLQAAEYALALLKANELPHLRQYIFNATFSLRQVTDSASFESVLDDGSKAADLQKISKESGCLKVHFDQESIRVLLLYHSQLTANEAVLFSRSLSEVTAVTYAALGLDMTGLLPLDSQLIDQNAKT